MAHIVVVFDTVPSKITSTLELCRRLGEAGHRISSIAPDAPEIAAAGVDAIRFDLDVPRLPGPAPRNGAPAPLRARWHHWRTRAARREAAVAALDVEGFRALLASLDADLLLIDVEAHEYVMAAAGTGIPAALVNPFFNLYKRPGVPPLHVPVTPGRGLAGSRLGVELAWLRYRAWQRRLRLRSRFGGTDYFAMIDSFAERAGFDLGEVDYSQALLPFVFPRLPSLDLTLLELDFPGVDRPGAYPVGPMTRAGSAAPDAGRDAVVREVAGLAERARASGGKLVYCSFGSYYGGDDRDFLTRVADAVAPRPDWTTVLALGGRMAPESLGTLPDNVHAYAWVPQVQALAHADCALLHGGYTSVYEAIDAGVPIVSFPFAEIFDQFGTASRVRYHGIGLVGDRRRDLAAAIRGAIERVLGDAPMRARVARMKQHMDRYREEGLAVRAVEDIIASRAAGSSP